MEDCFEKGGLSFRLFFLSILYIENINTDVDNIYEY